MCFTPVFMAKARSSVAAAANCFAMIATCVRAQRDVKANVAGENAIALADIFCRLSRRKIEKLFGDLRDNADPQSYRVARAILDKQFAWLETGIVDAPEAVPMMEAEHRAAAGK